MKKLIDRRESLLVKTKVNKYRQLITLTIGILFLFSTCWIIKAGTVSEEWARIYGYSQSREIANDVTVDSQDNIIITGSAGGDYYTIKYNPNGYVLCRITYDSSAVENANAIAVDSNDNIIVTGERFKSGSNDYYTIKYNSIGNKLWSVAYDNNVGDDTAYDIAVDSQDSVIVTGCSSNNYYTIKYDSNGNEIFNITYDSCEIDIAYGVTIDSNDNIIVTGSSLYNYCTIKYNKNGIQLWRAIYNSSGTDIANSVAVDSNDNIIVVGSSSENYYLIKYDPNGNEIWNTNYDGGGTDTATDIAIDSNDNIIVTGFSHNSIPYNRNYTTVEYDKYGRKIWIKTYDSGENDIAKGITTDSFNNIIVTGAHLKESRNYDYYTIKYKLSNIDPLAYFIYMPHNPNNNEEITFIDLSSDPDGNIISNEWDFGDQQHTTGSYITHSYIEPGTYKVTLTVTDNDGATDTFTKYITVFNETEAPKIYDNTFNTGYTGDYFTFNAKVTDNIEVDSVWVEYWYNLGSHNNESMDPTGLNDYYEKTITIPKNSLEDLHYIISANNTNNIWINTGEKIVAIMDNDKPEITNIYTNPISQRQNKYVNISCIVSDNIEVNIVKINITGPPGFSTINTTMNDNTNNGYHYNTSYNIIGQYNYSIWANDSSNNEKKSDTYSFTIYTNNPPYQPSEPSPENGSTNVGLNVDLWWTGGDPDSDLVTYDVYFEANNPLPDVLVSENQTDTHYDLGTLNNDTHYYWQIVAEDDSGAIAVGPVWEFVTKESMVNNPPNAPVNPVPANGETGVSTSPVISVYVSDPDGDSLFICFYNDADDSLIGDCYVPNDSVASVTWSGLNYSTTYNWYVTANDSMYENISDTWSFTTKSSGGGGGGNGGGNGEDETNTPPVADANGPYSGFVDEEIEFDGTKSTDDGTITNYTWDFGDGETGYGVNPTHTYDTPGKYNVTLTVTDNNGATDTDDTTADIIIPNKIPVAPKVNGPKKGTKNTEYTYTAVSTDQDNDTIQYNFNWDDGTDTTTEFLPNGTVATQTHKWTAAGIYTISVQAYDNQTPSDTIQYTVLIDTHIVDDIGYITDDNADGTYDTFHDTNVETALGQKDGKYLIDSDGDGEWDYMYNPETEDYSDYEGEPIPEEYNTVIILLAISIIIIMVIIYYFVRNNKPPKKTKK